MDQQNNSQACGSQTPSSNCLLCGTNFRDHTSLSGHLLSNHPSDTFRCVACVGTVSLFPTYTEAYQHFSKVHQVSLEQAIMSSILLPSKLVTFQCKLCSDGRDMIYLSQESVQLHLQTHSVFFAKRWKKYSERVCRICDDSLEEIPIENHLIVKHPREKFAEVEDIVGERVSPSGTHAARIGISEKKLILVAEDVEHEIENKKKSSTKSKAAGSNSRTPLLQAKLWDSFKPGQLLATYFPKSIGEGNHKKSRNYPNSDGAIENNNFLKEATATVKKEGLDKEVHVATKHHNKSREPKPKKKKTSESSGSFSVVNNQHRNLKNTSSGSDDPPINASRSTSTKDDHLPNESSSPSVRDDQPRNPIPVSTSPTANPKYESAVIPLPGYYYPKYSHTTQKPMLYSCSVCPQSSSIITLLSFRSWASHRESVDHRQAYGKAFLLNNCSHFRDAFFDPYPATHQSLTCSGCNIEFSEKSVLNLHYRRRHMRDYTWPITEPYCHTCKMPLLNSRHAPPHNHDKLLRQTYACTMCYMRVYSDGGFKHNLAAHSEQMFRCKLGLCKEATDVDRMNHYGYAGLHLYPGKLLQHQLVTHQSESRLLTNSNCYFPYSLVIISCQVCPYHFMGEDRNMMINHLKFAHNLDQRDLMTFSCRVCGKLDVTIPEVTEHARKHREWIDWDVASSSRYQQGCHGSDRDRGCKTRDIISHSGRKSVNRSNGRHRDKTELSSDSSDVDERPVKQRYSNQGSCQDQNSRKYSPSRSTSSSRHQRRKCSN